jgi:muconolactone delta-isomerase
MLILFHSKLTKPVGMTDKEFYGVWLEESQAALAAPKDVLKGIWKVAGLHEVYVLFEVESAEQLDAILAELPMYKRGYSHMVETTYSVLGPYEEWARLMQSIVDRPD